MGTRRLGALMTAALLLGPPLGAAAPVEPFRVIAHRGASAYAPENSLPAFEKALALGAREVELDVQLTRDDAVILFHDALLDEKTNGSGRVRDHDLATLRRLDIGTWFDATHPEVEESYAGVGLITLEELFAKLDAQLFYHVEIKSDEPELPALVLARVRAAGLERRVMITSFDEEQVLRTRALDAAVPVSLLVGGEKRLRRNPASGSERETVPLATLQRRWIARAAEARLDQVAFPAEEMTRELVRYGHERGLEVRAYRIRSRADMERALEVGANGMTINWPDWLIER